MEDDRRSVVFQPEILVTQNTETSEEPMRYTPQPAMTPMGTMDTFPNTTNTTNEQSFYYESGDAREGSPDRLVDRAPRARHAVDHQDLLWTQIDVLDDVRRMSEDTRERGSFFSAEHWVAMEGLRRAQSTLLRELRAAEAAVDGQHQLVWASGSVDEVKDKLYDRERFARVVEGLEGVGSGLEGVGATMRRFDR